MNAAVGLTAGLGLDGDRCIRVIPRHLQTLSLVTGDTYSANCLDLSFIFMNSFPLCVGSKENLD